uniref:Uncharacterized protein n=1 Tax=Arundo donax TaxID=35708 RepID=A0A0A9H561_ARUDO
MQQNSRNKYLYYEGQSHIENGFIIPNETIGFD